MKYEKINKFGDGHYHGLSDSHRKWFLIYYKKHKKMLKGIFNMSIFITNKTCIFPVYIKLTKFEPPERSHSGVSA